jgi:transposase
MIKNAGNNTAETSETVILSRKEYEKLLSDNEYMKQQLAELRRMIFGSKRERFISAENADTTQLSLFDTPEEETSAPQEEEITYTRKKQQLKQKKTPVRVALPSHLPRVEEVIEPDNITEGSKKIGEEVTEILEYNPSKLFVRRIVRPKYALPKNEGVIIGELPSLPIPKGNAGPGLLTFIMVSKYVDHLPFYRQIKILARHGIVLSDSTINGWFIAAADLLLPLYNIWEKELLNSDYIQADESPIGVQDPNKKGRLHQGFQWVFRSPVKGLVLFKYHKSRERKAAEQVLMNFTGTLQTDGYAAYKNLRVKGDITLLGCMAHARRYFEKALDNDKRRAEQALTLFQKLYDVERECRMSGVSAEERKEIREKRSIPILKKIKSFLSENKSIVPPKSAIGKAIHYTANIWPNLERYVEDGRYEIDNNMIENTIRPLALGRKNYLFAGSHKAAQRAAMMYSFFATCKTNDVDPYVWLNDVLTRIQDHKANRLHELLPANWKARTETAPQ